MPIKPLEKKIDRSALFKVLFLVSLIVTGILLDKVILKKVKDLPSILGKSQELQQQTQDRLVKKVQDSDLLKESIKKVDEVTGVILGEATDTFNKLTSDAGLFVSDVVYKNSIGKIVDQVDKLPKDQQEKIREQICK